MGVSTESPASAGLSSFSGVSVSGYGYAPGMRSLPAIDADIETVQLGTTAYEVIPQPVPFLKADLGEAFAALTANPDLDVSNVGAAFTGGIHGVLKVFIPDLMPVHEWEGYGSAEAMATGVLDRELARRLAPTGPQIKLALRVSLKVNGLDGYRALWAMVDPTTRQVLVSKVLRKFETFLESTPSASDSSPPVPTPSMTSSSPASPTEDATGASTSAEEMMDEEVEWAASAAADGLSSPPADVSASTG